MRRFTQLNFGRFAHMQSAQVEPGQQRPALFGQLGLVAAAQLLVVARLASEELVELGGVVQAVHVRSIRSAAESEKHIAQRVGGVGLAHAQAGCALLLKPLLVNAL